MPARRYAIMQGNGSMARENPPEPYNPEAYRKWPHLVAQGPSGQLAILPAFSGIGDGNPVFGNTKPSQAERAERSYHAYASMVNHKAWAWRRNKLVHLYRTGLNSSDSPNDCIWHPYKNAYFHRNDNSCPNFDTNSTYRRHLVHDIDHHDTYAPASPSVGTHAYIAHQDGIYGCRLENGTSAFIYTNTSYYASGVTEPINVGAPDCQQPQYGGFGNPGDFEDARFIFPGDNAANATQGAVLYDPIDTSDPGTTEPGVCDIAEHEGSFYFCTQVRVWCTRIGHKGSFIYSDYWTMAQDTIGSATNGLALLDRNRGTQSLYDGPQARVFAKHRGELFMLQADGKVLKVLPGGLILQKDLKVEGAAEMESPWASGIAGGAMQETPLVAAGQYGRPQVARPFLISFNGQLHAFLNYNINSSTLEQQTGFPVAKGGHDGGTSARGLCWFTSYDGINWSDRTDRLGAVPTMASGIITPSNNTIDVPTWKATTSPYVFSAYQNTNYPSGYGPRAGVFDPNSKFGLAEASQQTGATAPLTRGPELKPSGYRQATGRATETASRFAGLPGRDLDRLPIWTSGNLIDPPGTAFNALQIKLDKGTVSGFMFPTFVDYPSGFDYLDPDAIDGVTKPGVTDLLAAASGGVWGPWGQGARGWDYTGIGWRHTTGFVDDTDSESNNHRLRLCFSQNPFGSTDNATLQTASHFWELDTSSGWHQINYAHWGGAMISYQGVDLHDPEVIIPSGTVDDPNPFVDPLNDRVRVKFQVCDFGFWDKVNMKFEYTTDEGQNWHSATISGSLGPLSTATKETDPSGIFGQAHEVYWLYKSDIGSKDFPLTRIRMRAEVPF